MTPILLTWQSYTLHSALIFLFAHKASICHYSHSTVNIDNVVTGKNIKAYLFNIYMLGMADEHHLCVVAFSKGVTIRCKLRLDLALIGHPEYNV
ncbi:hypothetical protein MNBD_GAMMA02-1146 [hydrothermal vent metagenome]|uniref:Uncharacterized protein n=1 Tax=hydrothermal vent metagenome TaxID=652676 RepID=A0A3B0W6D2_9ZZZZ